MNSTLRNGQVVFTSTCETGARESLTHTKQRKPRETTENQKKLEKTKKTKKQQQNNQFSDTLWRRPLAEDFPDIFIYLFLFLGCLEFFLDFFLDQMAEDFPYFSPTAESFGVSAQIGSGVVRGDPELRFHQGSTRGSTRVPPRFHQVPGSSRVPPGFHQCSTRVPPEFHQGSTRFCKGGVVWGGLR